MVASLVNHSISDSSYEYLTLTRPPADGNFTLLFITWPVLVSLCVAGLGYSFYMHRWAQGESKDPKTWPVLGSQLEAFKNYDRLNDWVTEYFSDDHRTVKMSFLSRCSYLTVDPANVEHILKNNFENFPKGEESHHRLFDLLGNGILNTDGKMWKTHRKLASLEFSIKKLRKLSSTVYKYNALKLVEELSKSKQGVDIQDLLLGMTFNSICEVVFGGEVDTLSNSLLSHEHDIGSNFASALDNVQEMITRRYVFPWWRMQRLLNIGSERFLSQEINRFNTFLSKVIRNRKSKMVEEAHGLAMEGGSQDLLSRFISYERSNPTFGSDRELSDAMLSFVLAGRDTTASTLSWFLYCMCVNQDTQEKVLQEILGLESSYYDHDNNNNNQNTSSVMGFKAYADVLTYEALQSSRTPYLHAALAETLRLYPAVPRDGKVALRADVLPDGTILKAGDQVAYIPYAMGRMKFLWGEDALQFKPDRWLQSGTFQPQSPFKFTAFQAGPRMCLGKDAAYLQMKITAAMLLRFYHFELVPNHPIEYRMMNVMIMKYGLKVNVTHREL